MVFGDSTSWRASPAGKGDLGIDDTQIIQSQVLKAVMDTLSNMLNNTASGYLGNSSLFTNSGMNTSFADNKLKEFIDADANDSYLGIGDSTKALVVVSVTLVRNTKNILNRSYILIYVLLHSYHVPPYCTESEQHVTY